MKNYIYNLIALLTVIVCQAQVSLSQAEYFWDTDPGEGNGTVVLATDGNFDSAFEQFSKSGIAAPSIGLHTFNIRVKDNTGVWGTIFKNVVNVEPTLVPNLTPIRLSQAEYFWDTDPGEGNGTTILATDGNFNSALENLFQNDIPINQPDGPHVFNVRLKDNTGVWGPIFKNVIYVGASLSTEEFNITNLKIYPNPVKDILNLSFDKIITNVSIYNSLGQEIITKTFNENEVKVNVSSLIVGTYFVKISSNNLFKTVKIIKE